MIALLVVLALMAAAVLVSVGIGALFGWWIGYQAGEDCTPYQQPREQGRRAFRAPSLPDAPCCAPGIGRPTCVVAEEGPKP